MLVERLHDAAKRLQLRSISASLLTSPTLVVGPERARWAAQGWEAVDMETAVLFALARQVAAVRVVLDSPKHELSPEWQRSWRAALRPRHWMEAARLAPSAASQALLAARVVREAFSPPAAIS